MSSTPERDLNRTFACVCVRMRCADCLEQMVINEAYQLAMCPRCDRTVCLTHGHVLEPWGSGAEQCGACRADRLRKEEDIRSGSLADSLKAVLHENA